MIFCRWCLRVHLLSLLLILIVLPTIVPPCCAITTQLWEYLGNTNIPTLSMYRLLKCPTASNLGIICMVHGISLLDVKQHAVQCDGCDLWQHRTYEYWHYTQYLQYRTVVQYNVDINWQCETSVDDLMDADDHDANLSDLVDALSNSGYSLTDAETNLLFCIARSAYNTNRIIGLHKSIYNE